MGEQSINPVHNGFSNEDQHDSDDDSEMEDQEENATEEYKYLDSQLDALNSALDNIEQKNDDIHAQLLMLLESNREIRLQMQQTVSNEPVLEGK